MKRIIFIFLSLFFINEPARSNTLRAFHKAKPAIIYYSVSPKMPLSIEGLLEIKAAAQKANVEVRYVLDPTGDVNEIAGLLKNKKISIQFETQPSSSLLKQGLFLHYPTALVFDKGGQYMFRIPGYRLEGVYTALIRQSKKASSNSAAKILGLRSEHIVQNQEFGFEVEKIITLPRKTGFFFKPIFGTSWILNGTAMPAYALNIETEEVIDFNFPNTLLDPFASSDGKYFGFLTTSKGAFFFSKNDLQAGTQYELPNYFHDPDLTTYASMATLDAAQGVYRVAAAILSSYTPKGLQFRDYKIQESSVVGVVTPTIQAPEIWKTFCDQRQISLPMLSRDGTEVSGFDLAAQETVVVDIGKSADQCITKSVIAKETVGKTGFSPDGQELVFTTMKEDTEAIGLYDRATDNLIKVTATDLNIIAGQLAFPEFINKNQLVFMANVWNPSKGQLKFSYVILKRKNPLP